MRVLVDTSVWSLALRRRARDLGPDERSLVMRLAELIRDGRTILVGVVRQELLSGLLDTGAFDRLREHLGYLPYESTLPEDHDEAARCYNTCQAAGLAASPIDMLLCSMSMRLDVPILTTDVDFRRYAQHLPIRLATSASLALRRRRPR